MLVIHGKYVILCMYMIYYMSVLHNYIVTVTILTP